MRIKAVKIVVMTVDDDGKEEEEISFDLEAGDTDVISLHMENKFDVREYDSGRREFVPTGSRTFLIDIRKK